MKGLPNINYIVDNDLCKGCGVCYDACPKDSISFNIIKGLNIPLIDPETCVHEKGCSRCYEACPGKGMEMIKMDKLLYENASSKLDEHIGQYQSLFAGYSENHDIRFHSASGGLLTQILIYMLENKIIDGAVVTSFDSSDKMKPFSFIAKTKEEILQAKSTKYCPVSLDGIANSLKKCAGKYIVVGLPCHIQGFRNLEAMDKKLKEKIAGYFSIFCSANNTYKAQEYLTSKFQIDTRNLKSFAYRDDGCMGYLKAEHTDGRLVKVNYRNYYHGLRSFFKPTRCMSCIDHFGMLADVSFGDIQVGEYRKDKIGVNSLIIRNPYFHKIFMDARNEGYVKIDSIQPEVIKESQKAMLYYKRNMLKSVLFVNKIFGKANPVYDYSNLKSVSIKGILSVFQTHVQKFIGKHKSLWFIVKYFGDKRSQIE